MGSTSHYEQLMDILELQQLLGKTALLETSEGLTVEVVVVDAKQAYGHERVLIKPVAGSGEAWVNLERLREKRRGGAPVEWEDFE